MAEAYYTCDKCGKKLADRNFYTYRDGQKCELCKPCLTMHIDNKDPDTYEWILKKLDFPYIPDEWNMLYDRAYARNPYKITGMTVIGKYLAKMRIKQYMGKGYADSEEIIASRKKDVKESAHVNFEEVKEAYERGEITEAQLRTYGGVSQIEEVLGKPEPPPGTDLSGANQSSTHIPRIDGKVDKDLVEGIPNIEHELTKDDKIYLATKWGLLYEPEEWVRLEKLHQEYSKKGSTRPDVVKMICKTSLKMEQAIDNNDYDSYNKLSRTYDQMTKSANFTDLQCECQCLSHYGLFQTVQNFSRQH